MIVSIREYRKKAIQAFENNKDFQLAAFNILCGIIYWAWEPITEELIGPSIIDNTRFICFIFAIIFQSLALRKKINIHLAGLLTQLGIITHYAYTLHINNYHYIYIMGFVLILVLQSLTFNQKKELFSFYFCAFLISSTLFILSTNNQKLFFYNIATVLILGPLAAIIRIRGEEMIFKQTSEIHDLKIDQMNSKIQQSLTNLSSSLAHEINTPLTTILGYTDILNTQRLSNRTPDEKSIKKIESQVNKIKEITDMLGLLSSDPKQQDSDNVITSEEVRSHIVKHIEQKFYLSKLQLKFSQSETLEKYKINKGHMLFILNEVFNLFPNSKGTKLNITVSFNKDEIVFFTDPSITLQINDLDKMAAQIIANNFNYYLKFFKENDNIGIRFYKE